MADEFDDLALGMTIRGYAAGQRLFGRFVLKRILGRGGMGMVWLAWDERLEREVALKFLPDLLRSDAAALDDLKRETRRGLDLAHPHIVRVYDLVEDPNAAAIAMEFVDGQTLASMRVAKENKIFEVADLSVWVRQLCEALDYAHHRAKLVHRDLKPANLMINQQEDLKVTDFGIARSISDSVSRVTMDRGMSGTLLYMSPQQALGLKPAISDDVYAIGATLYELITLRPPFDGQSIVAWVSDRDRGRARFGREPDEEEDHGHEREAGRIVRGNSMQAERAQQKVAKAPEQRRRQRAGRLLIQMRIQQARVPRGNECCTCE